MDNDHLKRYFPIERQSDPEILEAIDKLRVDTYVLAGSINKYLPEGQAKNEMLMRLMHLAKDVELALSLDGVSRMTPMIVTGRSN
jgi:hypothetical protein